MRKHNACVRICGSSFTTSIEDYIAVNVARIKVINCERVWAHSATRRHSSSSPHEGECNVPRSLQTSISQTLITALCISLFYCCLIYCSPWAQALLQNESARHCQPPQVAASAWVRSTATPCYCIPAAGRPPSNSSLIRLKIFPLMLICVSSGIPTFCRSGMLWYAGGGLSGKQVGLTSLPTHSLIIITDWTNF